jgi:Polyketide cyclase / dehydrase and lipid transport
MSVDVTTATQIARTVGEVAAFAADPDNAPIWYDNIESVQWRTAPPLAVGSIVAFVARFLGRRLEYDYEIVDFEPPVRLVMRTRQGPFPMETTYTWEPRGDATHMTLRNRGEPAGFSKMVAPLMAPAMRRANRKDLDTLKALLESS